MPISDDLKRIYTGQNTQTIIIKTLEITHSVAGSKYLADWPESIVATDENGNVKTYEAAAFELQEPGQSNTGRADLNIVFANADGQVDAFLDTIKNSTDKNTIITYRIYTEDDFSEPQINPPLTLKAASCQRSGISYTIAAGRDDFINRKFPYVVFRPTGENSYPGLRR